MTTLGSILDGARDRQPFAGEGGRTGASFEQAVLADSTPVIIKHITPDDWIVVVGGGVSHLARVWETGAFERMPASIDHTMLAVEATADGFLVVMRDVAGAVLVEGQVLSRAENRRVLESMDAMYREFWETEPIGCGVAEHVAVFSPNVLDKLGHLDTPVPELMKRGWTMFGEVAPRDITDVMHGLIDDPTPLIAELDARPQTLTHGDLRLHNMGLTDDHVVLLDWELVVTAPPAMEFGWYLIISASRIDATREQVIDDFREISGDRFDARGLELGMISALLFLGWNKAIDIVEHPDEEIRAQERIDLDWWVSRVRTALETWSPL
ncbi:MAG: phosphotransferase [Actinomycetota bacterium]